MKQFAFIRLLCYLTLTTLFILTDTPLDCKLSATFGSRRKHGWKIRAIMKEG
jgi:hypothetical protein